MILVSLSKEFLAARESFLKCVFAAPEVSDDGKSGVTGDVSAEDNVNFSSIDSKTTYGSGSGPETSHGSGSRRKSNISGWSGGSGAPAMKGGGDGRSGSSSDAEDSVSCNAEIQDVTVDELERQKIKMLRYEVAQFFF